MAASFPTALQRTSDERWVTLDVVTRERDRVVAKVLEDAGHAAVVRPAADADYEAHLRTLLESPPPAPGPGVHLMWPDDLLHDLDVRILGYTAVRARRRQTFPLADYVDPARRGDLAPLATRRHHLRVARNVATGIAALHHAGHGRVRGRHIRLDDHAGVVVVRADELLPHAAPAVVHDDERRLGYLIDRLVGGRPWTADTDLAGLLRRSADPDRPAVPAAEWFHAIRAVERALPEDTVSAPPTAAPGTRLATATDLASALRTARAEADTARVTAPRTSPAAPIVVRTDRVREPEGGRPSIHRPVAPPTPTPTPAPAPAPEARAAARRAPQPARPASRPASSPASRPSPRRPVTSSGRTGTRPDTGGAGSAARGAFSLAVGLLLGGIASVAPFAAFFAGAIALVTRAAITTGRRRSTLGWTQTVAITLTRLVPFATGGLALAAFVLLDLLLVLGLAMAVAQRVFEYGPGFTLTWIIDLTEVPALVRWFAFGIGAITGMSIGGDLHERLRTRTAGRGMLATPAVALALALGLVVIDAGVVWWPLPATG